MRLIDADELEAKLLNMVDLHSENENPMAIILLQVSIDIVKKMDTVKAEPVRHGNWITNKANEPTKIFSCSECKRLILLGNYTYKCYYDYCPHCGAKMKGSNENDE